MKCLWGAVVFLMMMNLCGAVLDSAPVGVEKELRAVFPGIEKLSLKPVLGAQPVLLRIWKTPVHEEWVLAWAGLAAGTYNLNHWLDLPDSVYPALEVWVTGTMTDSDDGTLQTIRKDWQESYVLPWYTLLLYALMTLWVLALPGVWLIRRKLCPKETVVFVQVPEPLSVRAEIEGYLVRLAELDRAEKTRLWFLLLEAWREASGWTGEPDGLCAKLASEPKFAKVYGSAEAWLFAPDAVLPDAGLIRKSLEHDDSHPGEGI